MGKQKKHLENIIESFGVLQTNDFYNKKLRVTHKLLIKLNYKQSLNKKDLVHRILFEVVLSDDEIIQLLRIIFGKEK